jgi:hypothetical protein
MRQGLLKEDEDEEVRGTKEMQMMDLTDILSAIDMAAGKLCDIDPDWERTSTVKRGIRDILHTYYEILLSHMTIIVLMSHMIIFRFTH